MDVVVAFDALPDEMLCAVLWWLPPRWLWLASFVSDRWRQCAESVGPRTLWLPGTSSRCSREIRFFSDEAAARIGALLMDEAAGEGRTSVVLWLHRRLHIRWTSHTVRAAALGGHKHTIDCMRGQRSLPLPVNKACLLAALIGGPDMRIVDTIHEVGQPWAPLVMAVAVALGKRRKVSALHRAGCPHDGLAVALALATDRRDLLDVMAVPKDEIERATCALEAVPYCRQRHARKRYAHLVCDVAVQGLHGHDLARAILRTRDTRARGMQSCRHHSPWRCTSDTGDSAAATATAATIDAPIWGPLLWSGFIMAGHYRSDTHHAQCSDRPDRRQTSPPASTRDDLQAWMYNLHTQITDQQLTSLGRISRDSRDRESQARRRHPLPTVRPRTPPKERHRARNR
ncbi:F-box domain containing protein [Pandoravirus salinus]|uniref:F-box domain containing protein n=1 Tax=Pandoravirus salinus TaxID=1349410 RepID=S4VVQ0_9VIRU|nr:F-box domain [Pandoravirus salinus]AGO84724.1 F-box domain containing protein [Pandoravirus salinus]